MTDLRLDVPMADLQIVVQVRESIEQLKSKVEMNRKKETIKSHLVGVFLHHTGRESIIARVPQSYYAHQCVGNVLHDQVQIAPIRGRRIVVVPQLDNILNGKMGESLTYEKDRYIEKCLPDGPSIC